VTTKSSRIQQRGWWKWLLAAGFLALVLALGLGVRSRMAQRNSQHQALDAVPVQETSLAMNSEAHRRLPPLQDVLYDGAWASDDTLRFLERCRKQYPLETRYIDTYIAACYFWHDDAERGERTLSRLGFQPELIKHYERRGQWEKIEQITRDPQDYATAQASAWLALAQRAEKEPNQSGAEHYYLQALEHCPSEPAAADLQKTIWQTVRNKLGKTISRDQYVASLNTWAARVNDQALLKSIAFELGKLQLLDKLPGKAEVRP
jgi:hypothetical protein